MLYPVYFELLDPVGFVLADDKDGNAEILAAGVELSDDVFHVGPSGGVAYGEVAWRIGVEECLDDLPCLRAAGIASPGEHGHFKVVVEPGGKCVHVALDDVFRDGDEHVIPVTLCGCLCPSCEHEDREHQGRN